MTSNQIGDLSITEMDTNVPFLTTVFPKNAEQDKFGLGVMLHQTPKTYPYKSIGSFGWDGLLNTYFWVDKVKEITVLFYTQTLPFYIVEVRKTWSEF